VQFLCKNEREREREREFIAEREASLLCCWLLIVCGGKLN
jgi:hypothetical protein